MAIQFDNHCPTCQVHRQAIAQAQLDRNDMGERVHERLQQAHWQKEHDQTPLALRLFKMVAGIKE